MRAEAWIAATASLLLAGPSLAAPDPQSTYTQHKFAACPESASPKPGAVTVRRCSGPGGLAVTYMGGGDGAVLTFGRAPVTESIDIGAYYKPNEKIEWRGASSSDPTPVSAIVRYRIGPSAGALKETRLVVYRIEPSGRSCVMAVVRDPGADRKARDIVDGHALKFRCGSRRLAE